MEKSLFLRLRDLEMDHPDGKLTGLQREMLSLFLEVNPDSTMGEALGAVFEYLGEEATEVRLNAIAERLIADRQRGTSEAEPEVAKPEAGADVLAKKKDAQSTFGKALIEWISKLTAAGRLLAGTGLDFHKAQQIYCHEDYSVTDELVTLFLEHEWQRALISLEAACTPWSGGGKAGAPHVDEYYDMSVASDNDPQWAELAQAFSPR